MFRAGAAVAGTDRRARGIERQYGLLGDGLYLSQAALDRFGLRAGDNLSLQVGPRLETFRVAGVLPGARAGEEVAALDIGAAQERFGQIGRLHRIDVKLAAGAGADARQKIAALLPPGVALTTPDESAQRVSNVSRAYRVNLNVLALVALFTGAFLVFSTAGPRGGRAAH